MWYVLKCHPGEEEKIMDSCRRHLNNQVLKDIFIFTCDRMKHYQGQWHLESAAMFPDYIFLESGSGKNLSEELDRYRGIVQVLEDQDALWQVYPEEEEFLRFLCGQEHHLAMSRGYIQNGLPHVEEGPLKGMESHIKKIDRHKRLARLEAPIRHTGKGHILAGLEIKAKS